jgi:alanine dehydrogenase
MTVMLGYEALKGVLGMRDAIDLLEQSARHEAAGKTVISPRTNLDFENGSMRMLFAIDYESGYFASKAYNRIQGAGVRYVVSLYRLKDGELLALLDGQQITDLRTGAASGVIARQVRISGPITVGVLGSGNQARAQLESLSAAYAVQSAVVYSPNREHRTKYAFDMSAKLGYPVAAVDTAESAARGCSVVATATRSRSSEPVLRAEWLDHCRLLCAVGNTRKQFSEADVLCFRDAGLVVVDSMHAFKDTGELIQAAKDDGLPPARCADLAQVVTGAITVPISGRVAFKSVGTALQDLALAVRYYELLGSRKGLPNAPDMGTLR